MNEEEKINQTNADPENPQQTNEKSPLSINNSPLTINPMELHHPHHVTHKKKWGEYVLEFLMLFLAVFLGFVAENIREHKVDMEKQKTYMENVLDDLKADTTIYNAYPVSNQELFNSIDTLIKLIGSAGRKQQVTKLAFTARMILPKWKTLDVTNRTYEEMKSSGSLRLITNKLVANDLSQYYYTEIALKKYNDAAYTWGSYYGNEMGKIFDAGLLLKIMKTKKEQPAVQSDLLTEDRATLNELATSAQYLYGAILLVQNIANQRNATAQKLITLIKKEYHLENE